MRHGQLLAVFMFITVLFYLLPCFISISFSISLPFFLNGFSVLPE